MSYLARLARALRRDRRAVTALEYAIIGGAIAVAIATTVGTLGTAIAGIFSNLASANW